MPQREFASLGSGPHYALSPAGAPVFLTSERALSWQIANKIGVYFAKDARDKAAAIPRVPRGAKRARRADSAAHIDEWVTSRGLRAPK
jgi:hypothetical protein